MPRTGKKGDYEEGKQNPIGQANPAVITSKQLLYAQFRANSPAFYFAGSR
jgi:hypothetical protein